MANNIPDFPPFNVHLDNNRASSGLLQKYRVKYRGDFPKIQGEYREKLKNIGPI